MTFLSFFFLLPLLAACCLVVLGACRRTTMTDDGKPINREEGDNEFDPVTTERYWDMFYIYL
jgi:hypothetical protein